MNIYKRLFIILLSVFPFTANAFVDIPDNIIIDGKVHELYGYPLEKNTELAKKTSGNTARESHTGWQGLGAHIYNKLQ